MAEVEIKIPDEVLDKWHVYRETPEGVYQTFLLVTDYLIIKLYEQLTMYPERAEEIRAKFLEDNAETVHWREVARKELGDLIDDYMGGLEPSERSEEIKAEEQKHHNESSEECDCKLE